MANVCSLSHQIHDITLCPICKETLNVPKVLPCIHTFCLDCLDKYCKSKNQDSSVPCPLCRAAFTIPPGGVKDLPNNFFIQQLLLNVNNSVVTTNVSVSNTPNCCELCSDSEVKPAAANFHCVECDRRICERCFIAHKNIQSTKSHHVVRDDAGISNRKDAVSIPVSYCDRHPTEENILYCYDCEIIMCRKCVRDHSQHKLDDVSESAEMFGIQLNDDIIKVSAQAMRQKENIKNLDVFLNTLIEKVAFAESEISQKCDQLISLIKSQKIQLMEELNQFKDKIEKLIATQKDEMERQFAITESFKTYCQEMINKGMACDISRIAPDLHARAEQLVKISDESDCHTLSKVEITFKPTGLSAIDTGNIQNFIGELRFKDEVDASGNVPHNEQTTNLTTFLTQSTLRHVMPGTEGPVTGVAVVGSEVFVVRWSSHVYVYDSDDFTLTRKLTMSGSKRLRDLISCLHYNCLYAIDQQQWFIYRYDLTSNVTTNCSMHGECYKLSGTSDRNVLATLRDGKRIQEYTTDGRLIRKINLDSSLDKPYCCVQLSTGNLAVCNLGARVQGVCVVDEGGRVMHSYCGSPVSAGRNLSNSRHLAVDMHDNILVADSENHRLRLLSSTLSYLGDILIPGHQLNNPCSLYFDAINLRLYIGAWNGLFALAVR